MSEEYKCDVIIHFEGNHIEAESKQDYVEKVKKDFRIQHNIDLDDSEIQNVEVINETI